MVQQFGEGGTVLILRAAGRILEDSPSAPFHVACAINWRRCGLHRVMHRIAKEVSMSGSRPDLTEV
jgi:hypothetical protein